MTKKHIVIREFGYLLPESAGVQEEAGQLCKVSKKAFKNLQALLYNESNEEDEHRHFLKPARKAGSEALQVRNYVGVLHTQCGTQIEILPKIHDGDDDEKVRGILIEILRYLRSPYFRESRQALLRDVKMPLIEVFFSYFLGEVNMLVKKGIRSDYVSREENLQFLKGKLMMAQNIRVNAVQKHRFFTQYDEYLSDRPENRLIRSCLEVIRKASRQPRNQRLSRELLFAFDAVPASRDHKTDFSRCKSNRAMAHYEHVMQWCRIILGQRSPVSSKGATGTISILFPMERIFEDYVAAKMREYFTDYQVVAQSRGKWLVAGHERTTGKSLPMFQMRPDLLIQSGKDVFCVADTKWKRINQADSENKYGISQADMYQLYAYARKFQCGQVILIYPEVKGSFDEPLKPFDFGNGFSLHVVPFPLENMGKVENHKTITLMTKLFINRVQHMAQEA